MTFADACGAGGTGDAGPGWPRPRAGPGQHLAGAPVLASGRPALVPPGPQPAYSLPGLAATVQRAAAGLAGRGLRPGDIVGVYVPDAACHILACHAIRAAGGIPSPVSGQLAVCEIAYQLADCGARMLLTGQPLATVALAAADRSCVRQVFSFGEAPATTPFGSLLGSRSLPPADARPQDLALLAYVRRADGTLGPVGLSHRDLGDQLCTLAPGAALGAGDLVLAVPPVGDGRTYSALLDHALLRGATVVATDAGEISAAAATLGATAAIVAAGQGMNCGAALRLLAVTP